MNSNCPVERITKKREKTGKERATSQGHVFPEASSSPPVIINFLNRSTGKLGKLGSCLQETGHVLSPPNYIALEVEISSLSAR